VPPVSTAAAASFSGFRPTLRLWHIGAMTDEAQDRRLAMLMAAAQAGDRESYQAVLRACVPVAAAAARRQGHAPDAVDDVVQEVLLTVHRALATYDPARPFGPWLQSIASRRAVDAWRRHGRAGGREVHDPDAYLAHADSAPDADSQAYAGFRSEALRAAVARLPAGQREAIELIGLGEKSLEEAAVVTGRSKGALKVNFHRAIKALRTLMAPAGDV
jgi:RNA polymerase sigma-70 factor (ECF subfamily)